MSIAAGDEAAAPVFGAADRLLVVAPHPDDETLATGGLIQRALAAGAAVQVVFVTDGDNNPWPQRWIERRWRIDVSARRRWGQRRRGEALVALVVLGVAAQSVRFLGLPDQGLTDLLVAGDALERTLGAAIDAFAPTCLAGPSRHDRHPDHSAIAVALERIAVAPPVRRLAAVVHGPAGPGAVTLVLAAGELERKRAALGAHRTQLALSRGRLGRLAGAVERFRDEAGETGAGETGAGAAVRLPLPAVRRWLLRHAVLLIVERAGQAPVRCRLPLSRWRRPLDGSPPLDSLRMTVGTAGVDLVAGPDCRLLHAKVERIGPRWVVFDVDGWHRRSPPG